MNLLDLAIIFAMIFFVIRALMRGFIREMASLIGVVLGILIGNYFQVQMNSYLKPYLPNTSILSLISFALLFVLTLIGCNLLGYLLELAFEKGSRGWVNKGSAIWLAVAKGVILIYLVIILLSFFLPPKTPLIARSRLAPMIVVSYRSMIRFVSPGQYEKWKKKIVGKYKEAEKIASDPLRNIIKKDE
ncbi:MAG: CvpA family protein [Deltaproteobacteria bacterium]|nr:CvpA family protein [Deltaproteobacteria bacterium]MBW2301108.1 CvpA family protein [Deltaproteobacteria bacterium]